MTSQCFVHWLSEASLDTRLAQFAQRERLAWLPINQLRWPGYAPQVSAVIRRQMPKGKMPPQGRTSRPKLGQQRLELWLDLLE